MTTKQQEARDWELFSDWCASLDDVSPLPTTAEVIADFLAAFPAPIEAQGRRVRAIRRVHERAGHRLALPSAALPSALRQGGEWASVPRALAQVPKYHHPKDFHAAVRGRRDGWLLVLIGVLGLSRNQARTLSQVDVQLFPQIAIKGEAILKSDPASECAACAVTRWLRIAGPASFGFWNEVQAAVSPLGVDEAEHDCLVGLDGLWRKASTLLPWVDPHGWVSATPLSARSISATMAYRQTLGPVAEIKPYVIPTGGRFADASMNELADAYDDVDQRAAAALLRLKEIVGEGDQMLNHLHDFGL